MNSSIAIQVLPKVATNEETIRIVDDGVLTIDEKCAKHREE